MKQKYTLGSGKYISLRERFTAHLKLLLVLFFAVAISSAVLLYDFYNKNQVPDNPKTNLTVKPVTFDNTYYSTPYFRFTDSAKWNYIKEQSTNNKFVFQKYLPNSTLVQHQLFVYVNTTPPTLELPASRVLPVELNAQSNGFIPKDVSSHCGKTLKPGELHNIKLRQINGTTLLCDPDQGQLRVIFAKEGGDYNLKLKRSDGTIANYIIIYQNQKIDPDINTVMQIANSFQAT